MSLPAKALNALLVIKQELLSREVAPESATPDPPKREKKPTQIMRHARLRGIGYQRYKQRKDW